MKRLLLIVALLTSVILCFVKAFSADASVFSVKNIIPEIYTNEEIKSNPFVYGIGATERNYVTATFNEDFTKVIIQANGRLSDGLMIDWSVPGKPIENPMFTHRSTLKSVVIEENVKCIGDYAFINCSELSGLVTFPDSVEIIGKAAFQNTGINAVNFSDGVREIRNAAFYKCSALTGTANLDGTTEFIGEFAFASTAITELYFGNNVGFIGTSAFQECFYISNNINLPESLFAIGDFAFDHLYRASNEIIYIPGNLRYIGGTSINKPSVNTVENEVFGEAVTTDYDPDGYTIENYKNAKYLNSGTHIFYRMGEETASFSEFKVNRNNKYFSEADGILYTSDFKRLVFCPTNYYKNVVLKDECEFADELSLSNVKILTLSDRFTVYPFINAPVTQINYQNTLETALYRSGMDAKVLVKATNPKYKSVDGSLYSKDGKICYHLCINNGEATVIDGCETLGDLFFEYAGAIRLIHNSVEYLSLNIPSSVNKITNYSSITYPGQGFIDGINKTIDETAVNIRVTVDSQNMYYKTDKNGHIIKRKSELDFYADINADGVVDVLDLSMFDFAFNNNIETDKTFMLSADVNRNGILDINDYEILTEIALNNSVLYDYYSAFAV